MHCDVRARQAGFWQGGSVGCLQRCGEGRLEEAEWPRIFGGVLPGRFGDGGERDVGDEVLDF